VGASRGKSLDAHHNPTGFTQSGSTPEASLRRAYGRTGVRAPLHPAAGRLGRRPAEETGLSRSNPAAARARGLRPASGPGVVMLCSMYAPFFGLNQEPFSIAPDPRFLFMSERHREALAHLLYGLSAGGGFVLLTGEIGAGKTTVCRGFLEQVPSTCTVAYIFNPSLTVGELVRTVCEEFGVSLPTAPGGGEPSIKLQVDALNRFLLAGHAQGQQAVLVIDEAQSLSAEVLEQLRLLTNLETSERKLLQIILIGQPELRDMLARPDLEQLSQRVIARYHLGALSKEETPQYIRHRLAVAGPNAPLPFDAEALAALHHITGGVPRRINLLADRALLGAYGQGQHVVTGGVVQRAAQEVFGSGLRGSGAGAPLQLAPDWWQPRMVWGLAAMGALGVLTLLVLVTVLALGQRAPPALSPWFQNPQAAELRPAGNTRPALEPTSPAQADAVAESKARAPAPANASLTPSATGPATSTDVLALLRTAPNDSGTAWRELALRWNVAVGEGDPCQLVPQAGLACLNSTSGGLSLVRQLARPGVVALRTPQGTTVYALLVALEADRATLQSGGRRYSLSLADLAQIWRGEFSTLWRTPPGWAASARDPLESPELRAWVAQRLPDPATGATAPPGKNEPGAAQLRERLRVLQVAQGLPSDSVGLPVALVQLNRKSGVAEPQLLGNPER
jgi:general secretion pathway protein A